VFPLLAPGTLVGTAAAAARSIMTVTIDRRIASESRLEDESGVTEYALPLSKTAQIPLRQSPANGEAMGRAVRDEVATKTDG
jgi:hypothetical protein